MLTLDLEDGPYSTLRRLGREGVKGSDCRNMVNGMRKKVVEGNRLMEEWWQRF